MKKLLILFYILTIALVVPAIGWPVGGLGWGIGGPGIVNAQDIRITWDVQTVDVVGYEVSIDGAITVVDTNTLDIVVSSAPHVITVQAKDAAGQLGPASDPKSNDPPPDKVENVVIEMLE